MKTRWNKFILWLRGYCTKHLIEKEGAYCGEGCIRLYCPMCEQEASENYQADTERRLNELRGAR